MEKHAFDDPSGINLYKLDQIFDMPDFVKEAESITDQNYSNIPTKYFADTAKRKFPLNNKSNTWLSRAYFESQKADYNYKTASLINDRIKAAEQIWGVSVKTKNIEKTASGNYSIYLTVKDNVVHAINITNRNQYKEAAEYLKNNKTNFTYDMRRQFARGLYNTPKALKDTLDSDTSEYIEKAAGFGMVDREQAGRVLLSRALLINREYPGCVDKLQKYASELPKKPTSGDLHKTAELVDIVDRFANLRKFYGKGIESPEESLFMVTEKIASDIKKEAISLQNGKYTTKSSVLTNKEAVDKFFTEYMGEKPYENNNDMINIIESLPRSDADALLKITEIKSINV